jgi:hypothetical protein
VRIQGNGKGIRSLVIGVTSLPVELEVILEAES